MKPGTVYLIGAGPGDPGLITVRGADLLQRCDVIVHDYLCHPRLLREANPEAEIVFAGKGSGESFKQAGINDLLVDRARAGKSVARLKGGDPCVFGRGGEEAEHLVAHGIPFEIVPGVSAVSAVPAYAGIPLTHRDCCSEFLVVTGHVDPAKGETSLNYAELATFPGTRVLLMGVGKLATITAGMLAAGGAPDTPAAVIQWGTWGRQRTVIGTLATITAAVVEAALVPPAVILFGEVVRKRGTLNWFESRPLFGRRIVVTQSQDTSGPLVTALSEAGAEVISVPMIGVTGREDDAAVQAAAAGVAGQDWALFTSAHAWEAFAACWADRDVRDMGAVKIAVVGKRLAARVRLLGLQPAVVASPSTSGGLAQNLVAAGVAGKTCTWFRGNLADAGFANTLREEGAMVKEVEVYRTELTSALPSSLREDLETRGVDWVIFASPSAVGAWTHLQLALPLPPRVLSIGPTTSREIVHEGLAVDAEAAEPSSSGIVSALLSAT